MGANVGFLVAGYVITWVVLGVYTWRIVRRTTVARTALARGETVAQAVRAEEAPWPKAVRAQGAKEPRA